MLMADQLTPLRSVITIPIPKIYAIDKGSTTHFLPPYSRYDTPCLYMELINEDLGFHRRKLDDQRNSNRAGFGSFPVLGDKA